MLVNVIKAAGDLTKPNKVEMNTEFNIGDKFKMEYDWCKRVQCVNGYIPHWHKDVAEFEVVNIVCNMLINPPEIWVRLRSCNKEFIKRCGREFDAPEHRILQRKVA